MSSSSTRSSSRRTTRRPRAPAGRCPATPAPAAAWTTSATTSQDYKRRYEIKSKDDDKDWKALIELCRVLNKTPPDKLEEALKPILDIDGVLWFLALDNALINDDGYWTRASDYSIYRDAKGKFHLTPHDINETFTPAGGGKGGKGPKDGFGGKGDFKGPKDGEFGKGEFKGPKDGFGKGGFGGPGGFGMGPKGGGGYALDPLVDIDNPRMPLYRLMQVPSLKEKYLKDIRTIAEKSLDWKTFGAVVKQYRDLIEKEVEIDTASFTATKPSRRPWTIHRS